MKPWWMRHSEPEKDRNKVLIDGIIGSIAGALFALWAIHSCEGSTLPCPPEGDNPNPELQQLDILKNRVAMTPLNPTVALGAMLLPGDDRTRFDESQSASITGWVLRVKDGGPETCECHDPSEAMKDTHIVVGRKGDAPDKGIVVEVTRYMKAIHPDWTTVNLRKKLLGKKVTFTGPLFFDKIHTGISYTTNPSGKHNARWTPWEIHPVMDIKVNEG